MNFILRVIKNRRKKTSPAHAGEVFCFGVLLVNDVGRVGERLIAKLVEHKLLRSSSLDIDPFAHGLVETDTLVIPALKTCGLDQLVSIFLAVVLGKVLDIDEAVGVWFVGADHLCGEAKVAVSSEGTGSSKELAVVLSEIDIPCCMRNRCKHGDRRNGDQFKDR